MTTPLYIPEIHDPLLKELHIKWKLDAHAIGDRLGFTVNDVKAKLRAMGFEPRERNTKHAVQESPGSLPSERANPIKLAHAWLGRRLQEKPTGFWLDGTPASLDTVMRETNRQRKALGVDQCLNCERWKV